MERKEISNKPKILLLGLIVVILFTTIQEYTYGQTNTNQTNTNQTNTNQTSSLSSEQEFEEGEEIGEEDTL